MNIQIFGRSKCFDTKKAERWFKERRVRFQSVDVVKYGLFADGTLKGRHAVKHILVSVDGFYAIVFRPEPKVALGVG